MSLLVERLTPTGRFCNIYSRWFCWMSVVKGVAGYNVALEGLGPPYLLWTRLGTLWVGVGQTTGLNAWYSSQTERGHSVREGWVVTCWLVLGRRLHLVKTCHRLLCHVKQTPDPNPTKISGSFSPSTLVSFCDKCWGYSLIVLNTVSGFFPNVVYHIWEWIFHHRDCLVIRACPLMARRRRCFPIVTQQLLTNDC